ncbi:MAG: hypothetical protein CSA82_01725, partial [Actinobacteria bacterium]
MTFRPSPFYDKLRAVTQLSYDDSDIGDVETSNRHLQECQQKVNELRRLIETNLTGETQKAARQWLDRYEADVRTSENIVNRNLQCHQRVREAMAATGVECAGISAGALVDNVTLQIAASQNQVLLA